jgi:predicted Zn-dependent protease
MNTKEVAQQIIKTAKAKGADFCEVVVSQNEFSLKRIKQGQVDQPPAREQWEIDLAIVKNNHKRAITFDNPLFAKQAVEQTLLQMELLPRQKVFIPTEACASIAQPSALYDEKTAQLLDEYLLDIARQAESQLKEQKLYVSGKIGQGRGEITYQNSLGTKQTALFTLATAALYAFDEQNQSISAYANSGGTSLNHIDVNRMVQELIQKCELQRSAKTVDIFEGKKAGEDVIIDVIVEPYVLAEIFGWFGFFGFNGLLVERGESFISDKMRQKVMGKNITITDDPRHPENKGMGLPFDFEGHPRSKTFLIEHGVAKNAAYDSELAHVFNKQTTATALPPSARSEGSVPFDIAVEGGETAIEDMIARSKKQTLWITKPHYVAMKHSKTCIMTGVFHHGVFLVENGKVVAPVENVRFEQNMVEAFSQVEEISPSRLVFDPRSLSFPTGVVVPAMKIKNFRFVGSTERTV